MSDQSFSSLASFAKTGHRAGDLDRTQYGFYYEADGKASIPGGKHVDRLILYSDSIFGSAKKQAFGFYLHTDEHALHGAYTLSGTFRRLTSDPEKHYLATEARGDDTWRLDVYLARDASRIRIISLARHPLANILRGDLTLRSVRLPGGIIEANVRLLEQALDNSRRPPTRVAHISSTWPTGL